MEIKFEECVAFFAYVATQISFCVAISSTYIATFYDNILLSSVHLKFYIRSMRFEPVIFFRPIC